MDPEYSDWNRLRKKQYKVDLHPPGPPLEDISVSCGDLKDLPGSETLRGVHIAGFDFVHQDSSQDQLDFPEGDFFSQGKSLEVSGDASHSAVPSDDFEFSSVLDKRATFASAVDSVYVTPAGSVGSEVKSAASSDVQSTALFSCTSFGELRDSLNPGEASASGPPKLGVTENQQDDSQSPKSTHSVPARRASDSICPVLTTDSMTTLTGRDSAPIVAPTSILRRDTDNDILSRSASRTSVLGLGNTSRPPSAMSLGGARGLRLRKYASLNFDLDTVTSLDNDDSFTRPQSFNTSRRVSFVDSLKDCSSGKAIDANAPNSKAEESVAKLATASLSAPIGMGHPWSLKNLNNFRVASPSWHVTPNLTSTPATSTGSGPANMHNKLKKKQRTTSTPVLSATPRLQDKTVDLPEGLKQIGLGIGYTHTPSRMISPRFPGFSPGEGSHRLQSPTSTPGRRAVSIIGTTSAIQRCTSIFSGLRHGKQGMGGSEKRGQGRLDALVERASEESDALEAVMREMYGTSWTAEGGSPSYGEGGPENVRKPGKVYSVPGMPGMTETLTRSRADATSSTLRLVEQTREAEL
ncbi:hypothetical protein BDY19DRAFT_941414 [Irpex rosettiformis]|uniref:Uncharacterized protein n=1 Tax=Irpex rosettiformis TaxID=378272 RepID=A0ACB8U6X9_9APHY|nr:hypothetical protein BDY19DRAFT_941414 [Irpex rosettiformis]